jgi:sortase A
MAVGRVVLVAGILVLLFIPYLLWGTGLMTARSQSALRTQFVIDQHRSGSPSTKHLTAPKQGTTTPTLQVAPLIADPAPGSPVGIIVIQKIGLSMMVVEGTDELQLQAGPGHYPGTPLPGEAGNSAIAGHRTTYLAPFYNLDALGPGDNIVVTTVQGIFLYQVTGNQVVDPSDVAVVANTTTPQLTLTTCNPRYSASQRLVVHAVLVASALTHATPAPPPPTTPTNPSPHRSTPVQTAPTKNWTLAISWGLAVAVLTTALWLATRRTQGGRRALVVAVGVLTWLVVVFFFFQAVAPLLPASY